MKDTHENIKLTKEQKVLLADLVSSNESVVLEALKKLEKVGNVLFIKPLFDLYSSTNSENIKSNIIELITNLKDNSASYEIVKIIQDYKKVREFRKIISAIWESSIHFNDVEVFVKLFVDADEQTALELYTVIDQNISFISDNNKSKCNQILMDSNNNFSEFKRKLAEDLLCRLK